MDQSPRPWSRLVAIVLFPAVLVVMLPVVVLFAGAFYAAAALQAVRALVPARGLANRDGRTR
jgi:hypothetical protein